MQAAGKVEAANALAYSLKDRFKDHPKVKEAQEMMNAEASEQKLSQYPAN